MSLLCAMCLMPLLLGEPPTVYVHNTQDVKLSVFQKKNAKPYFSFSFFLREGCLFANVPPAANGASNTPPGGSRPSRPRTLQTNEQRSRGDNIWDHQLGHGKPFFSMNHAHPLGMVLRWQQNRSFHLLLFRHNVGGYPVFTTFAYTPWVYSQIPSRKCWTNI